jgi:16S rRNA (cytosine1402-N4)-methyltransferase
VIVKPFSSESVPLHIPVLLSEALKALDPRDGDVMIDGTFGRGGYARAILDHAKTCVWAIDRDPEAVRYGHEIEKLYLGRFKILKGRFGQMKELLSAHGVEQADGIVLDLGVSSPQIDDPARGFSFRGEGPLDMRMEQEGPAAADVVNTLEEKALADLIYTLGEERFSRRIARKIGETRAKRPITTTQQLADLVRSVVPRSKDGIDPATRTFQALRLYVNDELGELQRSLEDAEHILKPGGRLVVVSFHSLEDRCVKIFLRDRARTSASISRHVPPREIRQAPTFELITRRAVCPSLEECRSNPRSRSARLRAARRTSACLVIGER